MTERLELYRSPNGDSWYLGRETSDGRALVIHQPNSPSGDRLSHIELGEFLRELSIGVRPSLTSSRVSRFIAAASGALDGARNSKRPTSSLISVGEGGLIDA